MWRRTWRDLRGRGGFDFDLDDEVLKDIFGCWYKIASKAIYGSKSAVPDNIVQIIDGKRGKYE